MLAKKYQRYIFSLIATKFIVLTFFLTLLIWFTKAIPLLKFVHQGASIEKLAGVLSFFLPQIAFFVIPIVLFCTNLIVFHHLGTSNQLTILKNSGLNNLRLALPSLIFAIIVMAICYYLVMLAIPQANKQIRLSKDSIMLNYQKITIRPQNFEKFANITIYANQQDQNGTMYGLLLHHDIDGKKSVAITAESAKLLASKQQILLHMKNGTIQKISKQDGNADVLYFAEYSLNLNEETKTAMAQNQWKVQEQTITELIANKNNPANHTASTTKELNKIKGEIHQRIIYPMLPIIATIIAVSAMIPQNFARKKDEITKIISAIVIFILSLVGTFVISDLIAVNPELTPLIYLNTIVPIAFASYQLVRKVK